jgi:hypothetical protein
MAQLGLVADGGIARKRPSCAECVQNPLPLLHFNPNCGDSKTEGRKHAISHQAYLGSEIRRFPIHFAPATDALGRPVDG